MYSPAENSGKQGALQPNSSSDAFEDCHSCNCKIEADHSVQAYEDTIRSKPETYLPLDYFRATLLRVIVQAIIHTIKENPRMQIVKPKVKLVTVAHPRLRETNVTVLIDCRTDGAAVANPEDERRRLFDQSLTSIQEQFYNNIIQLRSDCRPTVLQWVLAYQGAQPEPRSLWPITSLYGLAHFAMDRIRHDTNLELEFPLLIAWPGMAVADE